MSAGSAPALCCTMLTRQVWTSARRRAFHTAWPFVKSGYKVVQKPIMSEINPCVWLHRTEAFWLTESAASGTVCQRTRRWSYTRTSGIGSWLIPMRIEHPEQSRTMT